jgi:hypothetical protein
MSELTRVNENTTVDSGLIVSDAANRQASKKAGARGRDEIAGPGACSNSPAAPVLLRAMAS